MGSDNIIRIVPKNIDKSGYIYSFLASKHGTTLLWKLAAGGVQPYISEDMLKDMPVPKLSDAKQKKIHNLIIEASELRVKANRLLDEADELFHRLNEIEYCNYHVSAYENDKYLGFTININDDPLTSIKAKNHSKRILEIYNQWRSKKGIILEDFIIKPFRIGPRGTFKRVDSETIGTEMVSQTDLHRTNPKNFKRVIISRKNAEDWGNDNQVLFPAVGNGSSEGEILFRPTLAYKSFSNRLLSGDIGRLDCSSLNHAAYLLIALRSKGGFRMMRAFYYGTQLRRPLWELLRGINIPIKDDDCLLEVSEKVIRAYKLRFEADTKENEAIGLVEKEIESWQK